MTYFALLVAAVLSVVQDDAARQAHALIEELRSDHVEVRERAFRKLQEMGKDAVPELRRAEGHSDPEVATRVKQLLRLDDFRGRLSQELLAAVPGIAERLDTADDHAWTRLLLDVTERRQEGKMTSLQGADLEPLVARALKGAKPDDEWSLLEAVKVWKLRTAGDAVFTLLLKEKGLARHAVEVLAAVDARSRLLDVARLATKGGQDPNVCREAFEALRDAGARKELLELLDDRENPLAADAAVALGTMRAKEAVPKVLRLTEVDNPYIRHQAAVALGEAGAKETVPVLVKLLDDRFGHPRMGALLALGRLGASSEVPRVVRCLRDPQSSVRVTAAQVLVRLGSSEALPGLRAALEDSEPVVRIESMKAIQALAGKEAAGLIEPLLADPEPGVAYSAAAALCQLGSKRGVPALLRTAEAARQYTFGYGDETMSAGYGVQALLLPLNCLVHRAAWDRLALARLRQESTGQTRKDLEEIAGIAALRLEVSPRAAGAAKSSSYYPRGYAPGTPGLEVVERLLFITTDELILEGDRLRLVSATEALNYWKRTFSAAEK